MNDSRWLFTAFLTVLLALTALPGTAAANPGQVEIAYGRQGTGSADVNPPGVSPTIHPLAMAVGPKNETVVLGPTSCQPYCAELHLRRFTGRGELDAGFGSRAGAVAITGGFDAPSFYDRYRPGYFSHGGVAIQADGKVLVAVGLESGVLLARFNPDGTPDAEFGSAGRVSVPLNGFATITSVAARKDGSIVVAGSLASTLGSDLLLIGYTGAGQLDSGFGTGGVTIADLGGIDLPAPIALRNGAIVVGAQLCCEPHVRSLPVGEFSSHGSLSSRFDARSRGRVPKGGPEGVSTVIARPNGALMVVGSSSIGAFVSSYLPNGRPDRDYGRAGTVVIPRFFLSGGAGAVRDSHGGVVLAGYRKVSNRIFEGSETLTLRRIRPDGRPDPLFGGARPNLAVAVGPAGRKVGVDLGRSIAMDVQRNGRIVVLAMTPDPECIRTCEPPLHYGLVRYFGAKARR